MFRKAASLFFVLTIPVVAWACGDYFYPCPPMRIVTCPPVIYSQPQCVPYSTPTPAAPTESKPMPLTKPMVIAEPEVKPITSKPTEATPTPIPPEPIRPATQIELPMPLKLAPPQAPTPTVPKFPPVDPKLGNTEERLPPIAIPTPANPTGRGTSNYAEKPGRVQIVPVTVEPGRTLTAKRLVNFFNRTQTDTTLTVQGQQAKLPKQSYLAVELPTSFTWNLGDAPPQTTVIPDDAAGVEIIVRR